MLDKIIILSCRKQAYLVFTDKDPVCLSSDQDVIPLLMWYLGSKQAHLVINRNLVQGIEFRRDTSEEITQVIGVVA